MAAPLEVEILAYAPTAFFQCRHCEVVLGAAGIGPGVHEEQLRAGLPAEMLGEYARLSDWARGLAGEHGGRIAVHVTDVASARGLWKALRHRVRRYPAVIVGGRVAGDLDAARAAVSERLAAGPA